VNYQPEPHCRSSFNDGIIEKFCEHSSVLHFLFNYGRRVEVTTTSCVSCAVLFLCLLGGVASFPLGIKVGATAVGTLWIYFSIAIGIYLIGFSLLNKMLARALARAGIQSMRGYSPVRFFFWPFLVIPSSVSVFSNLISTTFGGGAEGAYKKEVQKIRKAKLMAAGEAEAGELSLATQDGRLSQA